MDKTFSYTVVYMADGKVNTCKGMTQKAALDMLACPDFLILTITLTAENRNG